MLAYNAAKLIRPNGLFNCVYYPSIHPLLLIWGCFAGPAARGEIPHNSLCHWSSPKPAKTFIVFRKSLVGPKASLSETRPWGTSWTETTSTDFFQREGRSTRPQGCRTLFHPALHHHHGYHWGEGCFLLFQLATLSDFLLVPGLIIK